MKLESQSPVISASPEAVFTFLNRVENFEKLMPENISKFEILADDKFAFALKGMPEIILKKQESTPFSKIVLRAADSKIDFSLIGDITEADAQFACLKFTFEGDFNPMIATIIKGPI